MSRTDTASGAELETHDVVRVENELGTMYGVVTDAPADLIYVPEFGGILPARTFDDVRVLEDFSRVIGVDRTGTTHLYSNVREVVSRRRDGGPHREMVMPEPDLGAYIAAVHDCRGWETETMGRDDLAHLSGGDRR